MKVKKVLSFLIIVIVAIFIGIFSIFGIENVKLASKTKGPVKGSTSIAIVNQDLGIEKNGKYINFSEKVIENLGEDYVVTSRAAAKKGINNGQYAAIIIFQGKFSKNVDSINNEKPEKAQFFYEISKKLTNEEKAEIQSRILNLEREVNDKLSYLYVANILNEFHSSQDKVSDVLSNDKKDLDNINSVNDNDLIEGIELRDLDKLEIDINTLNLDEDFKKNEDVMKSMDSNYKSYISEGNLDLNKLKSLADDLIVKDTGILSFLNNISGINILPPYVNILKFQDFIQSTSSGLEKYYKNQEKSIKDYQDNQMKDYINKTQENTENKNKNISDTTDSVNQNIENSLAIGDEKDKVINSIGDLKDKIKNFKVEEEEKPIPDEKIELNTWEKIKEKLNLKILINDAADKINEFYNEALESPNKTIDILKEENKINALVSETVISTALSKTPVDITIIKEDITKQLEEKIQSKEIDLKVVINHINLTLGETEKIKDVRGFVDYILSEKGMKQFELSKEFNSFKVDIPKVEEILEKSQTEKLDIKPEEKPEEKPKEKPSVNSEEKSEMKPELKLKEKTEQKPSGEVKTNNKKKTNEKPEVNSEFEPQNKTVLEVLREGIDKRIEEEIKKSDDDQSKIINEKIKEIYKGQTDNYKELKDTYENAITGLKDNLTEGLDILNTDVSNLIQKSEDDMNKGNEKNKGLLGNLKDTIISSFISLNKENIDLNNDIKNNLNSKIEEITETEIEENNKAFNSIRENIRIVEAKTKEELKNALLEKQKPLSGMKEDLDKYNPVDYITKNQSTFDKLIGNYNQNNNEISKKTSEQDTKNIKFTEETYKNANENIDKMREDVLKTKEKSEKLITKGLSNLKEEKKENTNKNQSMLSSFESKLPYTRIGSLNNLKMYDFIASPLQVINSSETNTLDNVVNTDSKKSIDYKTYIIAGLLVLIWIMISTNYVVRKFKRGKVDE